MGNNGRNVRMSRRQTENRKRRQRKQQIVLLGCLIVLGVLLVYIVDIHIRLEEMRSEIQKLEVQQHGMIQTGADAVTDTSEDVDYVGSLDTWEVGKPEERTETEVLQRLRELAKESSVIDEIYQSSSRYPRELLAALANNPEMADFVSGYPGGDKNTGEITASEKEQEFPLFLQWDPRWGYESYGESCIGLAGCGPTCLSMVLFYLTGDETLTPDEIAEYSMENGYYAKGAGTAWTLMKDMPRLYDIKVTEVSSSEQNVKAALDNGSIIICAMGRGYFTTSGHYIVIYGYDKDGFMVNDPNCVARSSTRWTFSDIQYQIKNIWAYKKA